MFYFLQLLSSSMPLRWACGQSLAFLPAITSWQTGKIVLSMTEPIFMACGRRDRPPVSSGETILMFLCNVLLMLTYFLFKHLQFGPSSTLIPYFNVNWNSLIKLIIFSAAITQELSNVEEGHFLSKRSSDFFFHSVGAGFGPKMQGRLYVEVKATTIFS